jgi:uncharacterized membrane protein YdjX (TVP38/TMEM64 family)
MSIWLELEKLALSYGYEGVFVLAILCNMTFFLPVPLVLPIYALGVTHNPILLGFSSGLGSSIGEFSSYFIGVAGKRIFDRYDEKLEVVKGLLQRYGAPLIFVFAVTPLPDDLILVAFGLTKYDLKKAFVSMLCGKVILNMAVAYAGRYSFTSALDILTSLNAFQIILLVIICAALIYAYAKINWSIVWEKLEKIS